MEAKKPNVDFEPIVGPELRSTGIHGLITALVAPTSERLQKASQKIRDMHLRLGFRDAELHSATIRGDIEQIKDLLAEGIDPLASHVSEKGVSPVVRAIRAHNDAAFAVLLPATLEKHPTYLNEHLPGTGQTLAHVAAESENWTAYRAIMARNPVPDALDGNYEAPIDLVAAIGDVATLKETIAAGADARALDRDGMPLASRIIRSNSPDKIEKLEVLRQHGLDLQAPYGPNGETMLMLAAQHASAEVCEYLLLIGCDPNAKTTALETSLHFSSLNREPGVTRMLLAHGANPNAWTAGSPEQGSLPATPLMLYAVYNNLDAASAMVDDPRTAPFHLVPGTKETAFDLARGRGHNEVANLLKEHLAQHEARMTAPDSARIGNLLKHFQTPRPKPSTYKPS
jgi:ankyrin repeat protein